MIVAMRPERFLAGGLLAALAVAVPAGVWGADLETNLNARWRGRFAIVRLPIASSCDGFYNDNDVVGNRADSSARRRFAAGELAHVERIGVKRGRVDVFLDLAQGVLEELHDGPFTLYEPRMCKIQLNVPVADRKDAAAIAARLEELLELHSSGAEAEASHTWNGRRREPFPKDYERTLGAYKVWKAAQTNTAVQARLDDAIEEAARIAGRVRSDPDYLEGFAAGLQKAHDRSFGDCGSALSSTFIPYSSGGGKSSDWRRGAEDGERLGYHLELLRRLKDCFVPVPPAETEPRR
jgi:hypothetical protein